MLTTESDIVNAVNERESDSEIIQLRERFEKDFALCRLTPYQLGKAKEYENYTSNEPMNLVNNIVRRLTKAPLLVEVAIENDTEELRKKKSDIERFYYGCLSLANSRLKSTISPSIQGLLAYYATARGWVPARAYIRKEPKTDRTIPDIKIWDMLHVTWQIGGDGLLWACHTREISKSQAKAEYDIDINGKTIKVYDFWDEEFNKVVIDGKFAINFKHEVEHTPVFINLVGSTPFIQSTRYTDTLKDSGESALAPNRNIYPFKNKVMTEYATIVSAGAHNPLAIYSAGGKKTFSRSPYYKGAVIQLDTEKDERVEPLYKPEMPKNAAELLGNVMRDISMGGMPPIAGGELNFQLPYSAVNLLIDAASAVMLFPQIAVEETLEWICRELQTQYAGGGYEKLKLHGRDGTDEFFQCELSSKDVEGDWFPECKLLPTLPEDKPASYAMARTAVDARLLSRKTAMAKHMGVRDPDLEDKRILVEQARSMPPTILLEMATALLKEGRPDLANIYLAEFYKTGISTETPRQRGGEEAVQPQFATGMPGEAGVTPEEFGRIQRPPGEREQFEGERLAALGMERGK